MTSDSVGEINVESPERITGPLTCLDFARFSVATDDPNRVHIERSVAEDAGFPNVIGSGAILIGLLTDVVTARWGLESVRSAKIKLLRPLLPDMSLSVYIDADVADGEWISVTASARDAAGVCVADGSFTVAAVNS